MGSLVLTGDTSGSVTVAVPAVAGTNTATFPAATGTVMVSGNMPAFSAYLATSNQSLTNNVWTKVTLNTEEFDTASAFDSTTNYRFTPQVAGYYLVTGNCYVRASVTSPTDVYIAIYKNGTVYKQTFGSTTTYFVAGIPVTSVVYFNGSTDYVELYVYSNGGTSTYTGFGANFTYFNGCMIRSA